MTTRKPTRTHIIIKPGSKWKQRGRRGLVTVEKIDAKAVWFTRGKNRTEHIAHRGWFGNAMGYLPAVIRTPYTAREMQ